MPTTPHTNKSGKGQTPARTPGWGLALFGSGYKGARNEEEETNSTSGGSNGDRNNGGGLFSIAATKDGTGMRRRKHSSNRVNFSSPPASTSSLEEEESPNISSTAAISAVMNGNGGDEATTNPPLKTRVATPYLKSNLASSSSTNTPSKWENPLDGRGFSIGNLKPAPYFGAGAGGGAASRTTDGQRARTTSGNRRYKKNNYRPSRMLLSKRKGREPGAALLQLTNGDGTGAAAQAREVFARRLQGSKQLFDATAARQAAAERDQPRSVRFKRGRVLSETAGRMMPLDADGGEDGQGGTNYESSTVEEPAAKRRRNVAFADDDRPLETNVSTPSSHKLEGREQTPYNPRDGGADGSNGGGGTQTTLAPKPTPTKAMTRGSDYSNICDIADLESAGEEAIAGSISVSDDIAPTNLVLPSGSRRLPVRVASIVPIGALAIVPAAPTAATAPADSTNQDEQEDSELHQTKKKARTDEIAIDATKTLGWEGIFNLKKQWQCQGCLVFNPDDVFKCEACELPKSDEASGASELAPAAASGMILSAIGGGVSKGSISTSAASNFAFGAPAVSGTAIASSITASAGTPVSTNAFSFGAPASAGTATAPSTTAAAPAPANGFSFAATPSTAQPSSSNEGSTSAKPSFYFGAPSGPSTAEKTSAGTDSSDKTTGSGSDTAPKQPPASFGFGSVMSGAMATMSSTKSDGTEQENAKAKSAYPTLNKPPNTGGNGANLFGGFGGNATSVTTTETEQSSNGQAVPSFGFGGASAQGSAPPAPLAGNQQSESAGNGSEQRKKRRNRDYQDSNAGTQAPTFGSAASSGAASFSASNTQFGSNGTGGPPTASGSTTRDSSTPSSFGFGGGAAGSEATGTMGTEDSTSSTSATSSLPVPAPALFSFGSSAPTAAPVSQPTACTTPNLFGSASAGSGQPSSSTTSLFVGAPVAATTPDPASLFGVASSNAPAPSAPPAFGAFASSTTPAPPASTFGDFLTTPAPVPASTTPGFGGSGFGGFGSTTPAPAFGTASAQAPFGTQPPPSTQVPPFGTGVAQPMPPFGGMPQAPPAAPLGGFAQQQPFGNPPNAAPGAGGFGASAAPPTMNGVAPAAFGSGGGGFSMGMGGGAGAGNGGFSLGTGGGGSSGGSRGVGRRRIVRAKRPGGR